MDFPCLECQYFEKCTVMKWFFWMYCQQGRRKKAQTLITDFPEKGET